MANTVRLKTAFLILTLLFGAGSILSLVLSIVTYNMVQSHVNHERITLEEKGLDPIKVVVAAKHLAANDQVLVYLGLNGMAI